MELKRLSELSFLTRVVIMWAVVFTLFALIFGVWLWILPREFAESEVTVFPISQKNSIKNLWPDFDSLKAEIRNFNTKTIEIKNSSQ